MPEKDTTPARRENGNSHVVAPFQSLHDEIERLFHAFSLPELHWPKDSAISKDALGLRMDVGETDKGIQITAELPGVQEKDIDVSLENDLLRISAVKASEDTRDEKTWHVTERSFGKLERAMRVPSGIDPTAIKAVYKDGVLIIDIPKPAETVTSSQKIAVSSA